MLRAPHLQRAFPEDLHPPCDAPKYDGSTKPEDWLSDYTTAVAIAGSNKRVVARYVPLMVKNSVCTWLNSLPPAPSTAG